MPRTPRPARRSAPRRTGERPCSGLAGAITPSTGQSAFPAKQFQLPLAHEHRARFDSLVARADGDACWEWKGNRSRRA